MQTHKNQLLVVSLILIAVLVVIGAVVYAAKNDVDPLTDNDPSNDDVTNETLTDSEDGFTATATYQGNNTWMYNIQGELPNPCYTTQTEVVMDTSLPEAVSLNLTIQSPDADVVCAQMIQEVNIDGEYAASEDASMNLRIVRD